MLVIGALYGKNPSRTVGITERTRNAGRTDERVDGWSETNIPPTTSLWGGYDEDSGENMFNFVVITVLADD